MFSQSVKMCGIFGIFSKCSECSKPNNLRELAYQQSSKQRHRGPDQTGVVIIPEDGVAIIQERLAVLCVRTGHQPMKSIDENIILSANGEIYNYLEIAAKLAKIRGGYTPKGDCDVIIALYEEYGCDLFKFINGMFSFVLYDKNEKKILIARDPFGIIPLYTGEDVDGNLWVASEMKCFVGKCEKVNVFQPGFYSYGKVGNLKTESFYEPKWFKEVPTSCVDLTVLRQHLETAVRSHLQCDVDFGALLSGGVDSSLIASIATKIMREKNPKFRLKTYSVGLKDAPDFKYSQIVADYIQSDHTEVVFTVEQGLDCIHEIIRHIESYDVTTIRSSIPMYILSRFIKSEGLKMILSGEGADEIFGGYLYFHQSPSYDEFHHETVSRVKCLHLSDCLRANKSTMSWGLELRVPFLDTEFVNHSMSIRAEDRIPGIKNKFKLDGSSRIEKYILRAAFDEDYLPDEVLWRQKEQFSDGVGYSWIDTIRSYAGSHISDEVFLKAEQIFPFNTPATKEAFYYRKLFEEMFPGDEYAKSVMRWIPRTDWGCSADPSGRAQTVHTAHT